MTIIDNLKNDLSKRIIDELETWQIGTHNVTATIEPYQDTSPWAYLTLNHEALLIRVKLVVQIINHRGIDELNASSEGDGFVLTEAGFYFWCAKQNGQFETIESKHYITQTIRGNVVLLEQHYLKDFYGIANIIDRYGDRIEFDFLPIKYGEKPICPNIFAYVYGVIDGIEFKSFNFNGYYQKAIDMIEGWMN